MTNARTIALLLPAALTLCAIAAGCEGPVEVTSDNVARMVGRQVTAEGIAENRKLGPALNCGEFVLWIDGLESWPQEYWPQGGEMKLARVTGTLAVRHDLPVFIATPGEPPMSGMPVPPGTDLHEASKRYVLTGATWSLVGAADVDEVGRTLVTVKVIEYDADAMHSSSFVDGDTIIHEDWYDAAICEILTPAELAGEQIQIWGWNRRGGPLDRPFWLTGGIVSFRCDLSQRQSSPWDAGPTGFGEWDIALED